MQPILVSGCLFGWACRYDARQVACTAPLFLRWKAQERLIPFCPEVWGGLPTPRPESQRVGSRILTRAGIDVTAAYAAGATEAVRMARTYQIAFAIFKENSPSCGAHRIHDGTFTGTKVPGMGLAAEALTRAGYTVLSETELDKAARLLAQAEAARR